LKLQRLNHQGLFQPFNAFFHRGAERAGVSARGLLNHCA
jgi:hypothetical protein